MTRRTRNLVVLFAGSGVLHFLIPKVYESIVPKWLPARRALVYLSGVAELACAGGLVTEQSWAPKATAGVLLGVWPANVQMAIDSTKQGQPWWRQAAIWGRVPLQVPMLRAAFAAGKK